MDFKSALKLQASTVQANRAIPVLPTKPQKNVIPLAPVTAKPDFEGYGVFDRVEINVTSNRLDLFFTGIPSKKTRQLMKDNGFWYNGETKTWYHRDCETNRQFLRNVFDVALEPKQEVPATPQLQVSPTFDPLPDHKGSDAFEAFKAQVNELMAELKLDSADLMLVAIDCLHKKTFSRDS